LSNFTYRFGGLLVGHKDAKWRVGAKLLLHQSLVLLECTCCWILSHLLLLLLCAAAAAVVAGFSGAVKLLRRMVLHRLLQLVLLLLQLQELQLMLLVLLLQVLLLCLCLQFLELLLLLLLPLGSCCMYCA